MFQNCPILSTFILISMCVNMITVKHLAGYLQRNGGERKRYRLFQRFDSVTDLQTVNDYSTIHC